MEKATASLSRKSGTIRTVTAYMMITAVTVALVGLLTITVAIIVEHTTRGNQTLPQAHPAPNERPEAEHALRTVPGTILTGTINVSTRHADRSAMERIIAEAVTQSGGYLINARDDERTYAGPEGIANALRKYAAAEPHRSPDHQRYGELAEEITGQSGPPDISFTVRIAPPLFERAYLLETVVVGGFFILAGIITLVMSLMGVTADTMRSSGRKDDGE